MRIVFNKSFSLFFNNSNDLETKIIMEIRRCYIYKLLVWETNFSLNTREFINGVMVSMFTSLMLTKTSNDVN